MMTRSLLTTLVVLTVFISVVAFLGRAVVREVDDAATYQSMIRAAQTQRARILDYQVDEESSLRAYTGVVDTAMLRSFFAAKSKLPDAFTTLQSELSVIRIDRAGPFVAHEAHLNHGWLTTVAAPLLRDWRSSPQTISLQRQSKGIIDTFRNDDLIILARLESAASTANTEAQSALFNLLCFVAFVLITLIAAAVAICFTLASRDNHKRVAESQERLIARVKLATSAGQVGIWEWNIRTGALDWDSVTFQLFGLDSGQGPATHERWVASLHDDDRARAEQEVAQAVFCGATFDTEFRVHWPTGEVRNIRVKAAVVRDSEGLAERLIGTNWDVTEARTLVDELRQEKDLAADAAAHDALTGLFNRRGIQTCIDSRPEPCATLLYLDLDGFKAINDRGGHAAGDKTLCVVARIIKDAVRGIDACARVGGDEFLVVLLGEIRPEETRTIVARISAAVDALRPLGPSDDTRIGMSIGIGRVTGTISSDNALREADADLYRSKSERKASQVTHAAAI